VGRLTSKAPLAGPTSPHQHRRSLIDVHLPSDLQQVMGQSNDEFGALVLGGAQKKKLRE
jgi:hypothetical protein